MRQSATRDAAAPAVFPENGQGVSAMLENRGRPRSEESEEAILIATLQLLTQKPLRDITIEEIARKAGVGKATIYKWWPSKAYVALDAFLRKINLMVPAPDTGSVKGDIQVQLRSLMAFSNTPTGRILGQFLAEGQSDKDFALLFRERFLKPRREAVGIIFDRGLKRGEIHQSLDRELVLDLIYGPAIYRLMTGRGRLNPEVADAIVSILFRGLDSGLLEVVGSPQSTARKRRNSRSKAK